MFSALALAVSDSVAGERYKAMKGKKKMYQEKKKMYQKKFKELKNNCVPVPTSSPTITKVAVSGCYTGGKCNGSQYCCDCEMTQNDCDSAEIIDNCQPIWFSADCDGMCAPTFPTF